MLLISLKLIACSLVGMGFQLFFKSMSQQDTARKANLEYGGFFQFIKNDRKAIIGTLLTLSLFFLLFGEIIQSVVNNSSNELKPYFWGYIFLSAKMIANILIMVICVTIAYMGQDVALRFLGRTSQELKNAIDSKTTIADAQTGTLEHPTPVK